MTEKRFELAYEKGNWWAVRDGEITLWKEEVIGLLNEQEEIIQGYIESIGDLQHENEQLKEQIQQLDNTIAIHLELQNEKDKGFDKLHKMLMESYNENEELKKENKALTIGENETILKQEATLTNLLNENKQLKELQNELYDFRLIYNALLFNEWVNRKDIEVYKSKKHYNGELCFDGEWFIVVAILPNGKQISNHYHINYWDYFKIKEYDKVKDEFDGHTPSDVLNRLKEVIK